MSLSNYQQIQQTEDRIYNIPIGIKSSNSSEIFRHPDSLQQLAFQPGPGINTIQDLILYSLQQNGQNDFIGTKNLSTGQFEYEKYQSVFEKAQAIGSSLQNLNLLYETKEYNNIPLKLVGIYSKNSPQWTICDMANALYGYTMVPLYDTLGPQAASYILSHSGIITCLCSTPSMVTLSKTENLHNLKYIIALDNDFSQETKQIIENRGLKIFLYDELIIQGNKSLVPLPKNIDPDNIFTFSYTSGTTGNPKGAMITHRNILSAVCSNTQGDFIYSNNDCYLSYLPLPHIFERFNNVSCWFSGSKLAFYGGDMTKIREDIAASQPSILITVPRLLNRFYEEINNSINRMPLQQKQFVEKAIQEKLQNLQKKETYTTQHPIYDEKIFKNFRNIFGGKLRIVKCGSAPISQKVLDFMKVVLCCPVHQGYGQTEGTALGTNQVICDISQDHVGGVGPSVELKLLDVPEMGYLNSDKDERGNLILRGEICIRGPSIFAGYYKDNNKTAEVIDSEGWLHSGDIGIILPNGALRIIDRKKNIFKLSQGEYISPEKVENIYMRARGVAEVFLHGESLQNYCVAVIVPKPDEIVQIAQELQIKDTKLEDLCKNKTINQFYLNTIQEQGKKEGLFTFEQAQKIYIEPVSLVIHQCLTSSFKLQRHIAKQKFQLQIDEMYTSSFNLSQRPQL